MYKLWPRQAQFMTILSFDRQVWPWPLTYLNKYFKWHFFSSRLTVSNYLEIHAQMYKLWLKLNLWPFYHLTFECDLDLQPTWTNVSNRTSSSQGEQLCQIILKTMHECRSYGPDKLSVWPFYHLTFKCDIDLQSTRTITSNGTSVPQGQPCQIISSSIVQVMARTSSI